MSGASDVFQFTDPIDYLGVCLARRRAVNRRFSVRAWSQRLGFRNSSLLSQVLKRKRRLSTELAARVAKDLKLAGKPLRYFELIVLVEGAKSESQRRGYAELVDKLRPRQFRGLRETNAEWFALVADWHHWALAELIHLPNFREEPSVIARQLGISRSAAQAALRRLESLGVLVRTEDGKLKKCTGNLPLALNGTSAREATRAYHRQMLEKASESLDGQAAENRTHRGTTLCLNAQDYAEAEKILLEAHGKILGLANASNGEAVYQFQTALFRLS